MYLFYSSEGLEKMEKEKQKQMDREKDKFSQETTLEKTKTQEKEITNLVKNALQEMVNIFSITENILQNTKCCNKSKINLMIKNLG